MVEDCGGRKAAGIPERVKEKKIVEEMGEDDEDDSEDKDGEGEGEGEGSGGEEGEAT